MVGIGFGTDYGKKGASMHFAPQKIRFPVAEFDVDEDFAIEHDLVLWLGIEVQAKNKCLRVNLRETSGQTFGGQ